MKKGIHPKSYPLTVQIGKDEFQTYSTINSRKILMDVDFRKHPAWNKSIMNIVNQANKSVSAFHKKFGNLSFNKK